MKRKTQSAASVPAERYSLDRLVRSYIQIEASVYEIQEAKRKLAERIAEHMRQERKARGISQAEFARRMECTPGLLCYMENGERTYCGKWALAASNVLAEFDSANTSVSGPYPPSLDSTKHNPRSGG